ncbi:far upstream element-binding protein 1-like isoform X1 [Iris pallida]|uniref:Far upstream element-binding protein 1-like isoform X1 n=1 Tax=Iris pallida TaxID=29817 RepID=A0AAX6IBQ2_IRIPA|nr:far upstream element-binding protein 1-like isoform X1 [Iris pallida]
MAEESTTPATSSATEIPPIAEQEESAPEERSDAPEEEEEAKEAPLADDEEAPDHKRKLEELEKEAEEEKKANLNPEQNAAEVEEKADGDAKRQKFKGDAGVGGVQEVQNLEASVVDNGQPPSTEGTFPGSVDISQTSEVVSEEGTLPSVGLDVPCSRKIEVPNNKVAVLIGKAGETIRNLQHNSGAQIQITRDAQADPSSTTRPVELIGTLEHINKAEQLIKDVIAEADAGGSPALIAQGYGAAQFGTEVFEMQVPNEKVGMIIGKGGETIKNLQATSGAKIQLIPQHLSEGDVSKERTVRITGNKKQIEVAKEVVKEVMNKVPVRPSGGYPQSSRPRWPGPVPQWGPRAPPTSQNQPQPTTGYDYQQTGTYPPQPTQYPQSYGGGYPQLPPPRSSTGWEQRPGAPVQNPPTGGYNYYGQGGQAMGSQQPNPVSVQTPAPVNYNYGHQQAAGYGQTNPYPQSGPPQQNYGPGYNEPKYDNQTPSQQIYGHQLPVSSHSGFYPQQGSTTPQPDYAQQQPYIKPAPYSGAQQSYGPPSASQPADPMYQTPVPAYGSVGATQQPQPYNPNAPPSQTAPAYNQTYGLPSGPVDGYNQPPSAGYPQPVSQVAPGFGQGAQPTYAQAGAQSSGYGQYPSTQPGYGEQPPANSVNYGYQGGPGDTTYGSVNPSSGYGVAPAVSSQPGYPQAAGGYAQPAANPAGYDQSTVTQYGYGSQPASAPVGYAKGVSPQPGGYGGWAA